VTPAGLIDANPHAVRNADGWVDEDGACCVCGWPDARLVTDHCHATGFVRGRLCVSCNLAEGRDAGDHWEAWRLTAPCLAERTQYVGWGARPSPLLRSDELASLPMTALLALHRERVAATHLDRGIAELLEAELGMSR